MYYTYGGVTTWSKWSANFNAVPQAKIKAKKKWTKVKTLKAKSGSYTFTKLKKKRITVNAVGYDLQVRTTGKVNGKKMNSTSYYYTNYYLI
ncbi:MAG: hypothetical protein J1F22_02595 [Lachnospiraceae bacterium]|nr:hypothetical protein [Lachnospiraceae bacterium]